MINTALILAAGVGSRLQHITHSLPKALVPVNNIPTLKRQIDSLALNKIKTVNVVCSFEGSQINKDMLDGNRNGNFYGAIRDSVSLHPVISLEATDEIFEINTLQEYQEMHHDEN